MFTANERGAGRKKALSAEQIQQYKNRHLNGETILALSKEAGVSRQTLSAYMKEETPEERIIRRYTLWAKLNREFHAEHLNQYHLRIDYMNENQCCTVILVDFQKEEIKIINKTNRTLLKAFGVVINPTWEDFQLFLKERCIPESRFGLKQILRDMNLTQYDPLQILEKTEGRTKEDEMWLKFTYYNPELSL